jgi:hypothetical protein
LQPSIAQFTSAGDEAEMGLLAILNLFNPNKYKSKRQRQNDNG